MYFIKYSLSLKLNISIYIIDSKNLCKLKKARKKIVKCYSVTPGIEPLFYKQCMYINSCSLSLVSQFPTGGQVFVY